jgi:hypothetical protein
MESVPFEGVVGCKDGLEYSATFEADGQICGRFETRGNFERDQHFYLREHIPDVSGHGIVVEVGNGSHTNTRWVYFHGTGGFVGSHFITTADGEKLCKNPFADED